MKKLLIVSHAMEIGGAERALLGLLENIDTTRYQVDLFLLRHEGELLPLLPPQIRLLPELPQYATLAHPVKSNLKNGHFCIAAARLNGKLKARRFEKKHGYHESGVALDYSHKYTKRFMPPIAPDVEYDLAISFLTPHYFVAEKVRAKKRIAWIHTDYSYVQIDRDSELKMWSRYDYIASISDDVTTGFVNTFPELREKIVLIENILPRTLIEKQAVEPIENELEVTGDQLAVLSAGRFSYQKNFENIPDICRRICAKGCDIKWFIMGYGAGEDAIRKAIIAAGMQEHVIIIGKKENPYPYIKACDVYIQPSRYEGKCVAVREAQLLQRPVVITAYPTAGSQLENGVDGIVVPLDNEGCAEGIAALLRDPQKIRQISEACASRDYTNSDEIKKLYAIIGD